MTQLSVPSANQLLRDDHKRARGLFSQLEALTERTPALVEPVSRELFLELEIHSLAERELYYPALMDAVNGSASGIEARTELQVSDAAQLQRWPADVEYAAFMIAREALLNALRHAGARVIRLGLDGDDEWLELTIDDDGRGFLPGDAQVGLVGMRERALAVGAELHIDARPGHGTMVALTWTPD